MTAKTRPEARRWRDRAQAAKLDAGQRSRTRALADLRASALSEVFERLAELLAHENMAMASVLVASARQIPPPHKPLREDARRLDDLVAALDFYAATFLREREAPAWLERLRAVLRYCVSRRGAPLVVEPRNKAWKAERRTILRLLADGFDRKTIAATARTSPEMVSIIAASIVAGNLDVRDQDAGASMPDDDSVFALGEQ